ncbi:MAG: DRTGG domain-containing protein [Desulfobacterales bacterium]
MKLSEIRDILKADILTGEDQLNKTIVAGGGADIMDAFLSAVARDAVVLTGVTTEQVVQTAKIAEVGAVVFVRGQKPKASVIQQAKTFGLPLLVTEFSMFVSIGKLYMNGLRGLDGSW